MLKRFMLFFVLFVLSFPVWGLAQSKTFTLTGEISFKKQGNIRLALMTKEEFEADKGGRKLILKIGPKEIKKGRVSFTSKDVPPGTYGIKCFQDVNGNKKLDKGLFGPKEPWGNYRSVRPFFRGPKFEEIAFEVDKDMTDIRFEIK